MPRPSLFIGSSKEGIAVAQSVRAQLKDDAEATIFNEGVFGLNQGSLESLVQALDVFDFAALVLTPDDMIESREQFSQSPRDNILFECGLFMGRLGRERTFIIYDSAKKIKIPSDLAGVSVATYDGNRSDGNLKAAVGEACDPIRDAIKRHTVISKDEKVIYDTRELFDPYDFKGRENYTWDNEGKPNSPMGEGRLDFEDDRVLHITRGNTVGRFEVHLQHNGPDKPSIFKQDPAARKLRVRCEARSEGESDHTLRFVFKDNAVNKLTDRRVKVLSSKDSNKWQKIDERFQVSPTADLFFRIDDEVISQKPGSVKIRDLVVTEKIS